MTRREFAAALAAAGVVPTRRGRAAAFPVHYARPNPYDAVFRYLEPGSDAFKSEKEASETESRLAAIFEGREPAPAALQAWTAKKPSAARFFVLPGNRVRFEIKTPNEYHTGLWQLPDFKTLVQDTVAAPKPFFRDVTSHVFGGVDSFTRQLLPGNSHWRARLDSATGIDLYGNQGIAAGDIDNDGADEIYVCQPGGLPNRLYKIRPDGTAEDITERAGLGILDETTSALFVDFRNSGHQDLIILRGSGPLLFRNRGDGTFAEQPNAFNFKTKPQGSFTGMAAADYDRDGRVDLYLCCYVYFQSEDQYQYPAPYHDARNGPPNFLFRNSLTETGGTFEDVTEESGISENNDRFSFAPAWCDFDGDGWPDLYVANDFGRNNLYRNRNGRFSDEAAAAGVEDIGPGMSASWFDYDGDGRPDLYVSDMWTAAGQRIVRDPAFGPAAQNPEAYRRHSKGNSLYRNQGDGTFAETGARENVEMGRWAWSSGGFDFDLDGVPEILIATGMLTNESSKDLNSFFWRQVVAQTPTGNEPAPAYENGWNALNQLIREDYSWNGHEPNVFYVKRGDRYVDCSGVSGLDFPDDTRSFAVTDFDGDGNPDIVLKSRLGPQIRALQNDSTNGRPTVALRLTGTKSNRDAIGTRVEVNGQLQFVHAGSGFLSQHSKTLHFGLKEQDRANVRIVWPSGAVQEFAALEPGYTYAVTENDPDPARTPFRTRRLYAATPVQGINKPEPADTWLLEPVPTPIPQRGPAVVTLTADQLAREKDEVAASWALFRRYLFEYRAGLSLPMAILVDSESRARKIYSGLPSDTAVRADRANIDRNRELALPFPGRYYSPPSRNYFKLGAAFYWAGYPHRALPYLAETLRAHPENWKALLAAGRIEQELGRNSDAIKTFERVLALHPGYAPAMVNAGEAYMALNDRASARTRFDEALRADPQCADAANQLGVLAAEANDVDQAKQWFERAISARRDHSGAINNLAVLYAKMGKPDDSIAAFRYGIQMDPDDDQLYLNLARVYVTMGERDQAKAVLNQLIERKPESKIAANALSQLEAR